MIEFDHVSRRFSETVLGLDDVNLTVSAGSVVVLLGSSGSGKSTLLRHVNGLQSPTTGTVRVLGQEIAALSEGRLRSLRRRIGFIFQGFHLVGNVSVLENVCTGMLGSLRGPRMGLWSYPRSCRRQALDQLDRFGLIGRAFQRTDSLSGGQQQRVAIARALIQRPSILLADEPVASLDPESSTTVLDVIRQISVEDDLTVLCSLHQVDLALQFADRVVGLRSGSVVLDETAEQLTTSTAMTVYGTGSGQIVQQPLPSGPPVRPAGSAAEPALV